MNERPEAVDIIVEKKKDYWRASTIQMVDRWTPDPDRHQESDSSPQATISRDTLDTGVGMQTPFSSTMVRWTSWGS